MNPSNNPMRTALMAGLAAAIIYIGGLYIYYLQGPQLFAMPIPRIALFAVIVAIGMAAGWWQRKQQGGYITMREGFKVIFLTFLIAEIAFAVFNWLLYTRIDPQLSNRVLDYTIEQTRQMMKGLGTAHAEIEQTIANINTNRNMEMSFKTAFFTTLQFLMVWGLLAIMGGAVLRKKAPEKLNG